MGDISSIIASSLLHPSPARWRWRSCDSLLTTLLLMDGGVSQLQVSLISMQRAQYAPLLRARALRTARSPRSRAHAPPPHARRAACGTANALRWAPPRAGALPPSRVGRSALAREHRALSRRSSRYPLARKCRALSIRCAPTLLLHMRYVRGICASSFSAVFPPCDRPPRSVPCTRSPAHTVCAHCSQLSSNGARSLFGGRSSSAVALRRRSPLVDDRARLLDAVQRSPAPPSSICCLCRQQCIALACCAQQHAGWQRPPLLCS